MAMPAEDGDVEEEVADGDESRPFHGSESIDRSVWRNGVRRPGAMEFAMQGGREPAY
jgi:hypothetical protein